MSKVTEIHDAWEQRHEKFGNSKRSVLFKNLPDYLNNRIHRLHIQFIQNALNDDTKTLLDVGCGYGRISKDLLKYNSGLNIEGLELSTSFAHHFEKNIGTCYQGSLQDFIPTKKYDAIIIVTMLMYIDSNELPVNIEKIWQSLQPGGVLICIEPIENFLVSLRQKYKLGYFKPTGENRVNYFNSDEFNHLFNFPDSITKFETKIGLLPLLNMPILHKAITITKQK